MPEKSTVGRKPAIAPKGYMTMAEVVEKTGVTYSVVRRHIRDKLVHFRRDPTGVWFVLADDVDKIAKHEPPEDRTRIPVQLSPSAERHESWAAAAEARGVSVTELAYQALDRLAGYKADA